jgi:predicted nucleic acid-binding protein
LNAGRAKRLEGTLVREIARRIAELPIRVQRSSFDAIDAIIDLSSKHKLTAYDASYLHLALTHGIPLLTNDAALKKAAKAEHVPVFQTA